MSRIFITILSILMIVPLFSATAQVEKVFVEKLWNAEADTISYDTLNNPIMQAEVPKRMTLQPGGSWMLGRPVYGVNYATSGDSCYATVLDGYYNSFSTSRMDTEPFYVPPGEDIKLSFNHYYDIERRWDGARVLLSTDGGKDFILMVPKGGYSGTLYSHRTPAYNGKLQDWSVAEFNISKFVDSLRTLIPPSQIPPDGIAIPAVILRFELVADASREAAGWYLDDIRIKYAEQCDVGVKELNMETLYEPSVVVIQPEVVVTNYGLQTQTFPVQFTVTKDGDTISQVSKIVSFLPQDQDATVTFDITLTEAGIYRAEARTRLDCESGSGTGTGGDQDETNDIRVKEFAFGIPRLDDVTQNYRVGGTLEQGSTFWGIACGDLDNDNWEDFVVAKGGRNEWYINRLGVDTLKTFIQVGLDDYYNKLNNRNALMFDFENDNDEDIWFSSNEMDNNQLFLNAGPETLIIEDTSKAVPDTLYPWTLKALEAIYRDKKYPWGNDGGNNKKGNLSATALDYDNDGYIDLYISSGKNIAEHELFHNEVDKAFKIRTFRHDQGPLRTYITEPGSAGQSCIAFDYDNDNDMDIYQLHHHGPNWLLQQTGMFSNYAFKEIGFQSGVGIGTKARKAGAPNDDRNQGDQIGKKAHRSARGVAVADFDRNGYMDMYVGNGFPDGYNNELFRNNGDGTFTDISQTYNSDEDKIYQSVVMDDTFDTQGVTMFDYDNDGDIDIFVGNTDWSPQLYIQNNDGSFTDIAPYIGISELRNVAGVIAFDFDNDGWLDIDLTILEVGNRLFRNTGGPGLDPSAPAGANRWAKFKLVGMISNKSAIGARVVVKANDLVQTDQVTCGGAYFGMQKSKILHFGLGNRNIIDEVTVYWPSGRTSKLANLATNQMHVITEPTDNPAPGMDNLVMKPTIHAIGPNPLQSDLIVKYSIPYDMDVKMEMFDIKGRLVTFLQDGSVNGGHHTLTWNGNTKDGINIPAGVYYVTFKAGEVNKSYKIVKMR